LSNDKWVNFAERMKSFVVPAAYRSSLITGIKQSRRHEDQLKKDFSPTRLDFGEVEILLARHFGFCYGVENAIEISFRAVEENPDKRVYLLSEMIHNPLVNGDLASRGVQFILNTEGGQVIPWSAINRDDIVIIPAFGTTLEIEQQLKSRGIEPLTYNTTCPFVERVWNKAESIGRKGHTVIVHGKPGHEETRATFSRSKSHAPTVVIRNMEEAILLSRYITKKQDPELFYRDFAGQHSGGFDPVKDLERVGVVNQTTMLAAETQAIADYIRRVMMDIYGLKEIAGHFSDTKDTLCYATNDNQSAVIGMLGEQADLAIVVGGYNSSNTSHLVELCEGKLPTYFISSAEKILSSREILHWDFHNRKENLTSHFLPEVNPVKIMLTSGASCPDALVEGVMRRVLNFYAGDKKWETWIEKYRLHSS